jgi:hypothetical protein
LLSFFRINDPYRLIFILIVLTTLRLPVFLGDMPLMLPEVGWMVIGEKLASGAILYADIWDNIAPFSAAIYWIIHQIFGRSVLPYHLISFALVFFQAILFNTILNNTKAYNEVTFIPALVYVLLMNLFIDFSTLSPVLMSITFILFAINNIFYHIDNQSWVGNLLNTGLFIGIASLFYLPCILFVLPVLLAYILFTATNPRRYFLFLYGALLPYLMVGVYFFWFDALDEFYNNFILANFFFQGKRLMLTADIFFIAAIPAIYLLLSFFKIFEANRYTSIQVRFQQSIFFMILAAGVSWVLTSRNAPFQLIMFVPFATFFIGHFFLLIQRKIFAEAFFAIFLASIYIVQLGSAYNNIVPSFINYEALMIIETPLDNVIRNKKILVLSDDLHYFKNAKLATPYLNWNLAKFHFKDPLYYDNLAAIYANLSKDLPEVIIDKNDVFANVLPSMPKLEQLYLKKNDADIFLLKNN